MVINLGHGNSSGIPKVIDLTALGPKKVFNITLPEVGGVCVCACVGAKHV